MRKSELVIDTVPDPEPGPGEILVRTLSCGICSSDLQALADAQHLVSRVEDWGQTRPLDPSRDLILGHEFCAEVVDYGPDTAHRLSAGTRVVSVPAVMRPGRVAPVGLSNDFPGGYGELMILSEPLAVEVPSGLSPELAALTEPMAGGLHAVEKARLESTDAPLVIGCGPAGLAVVAALKIANARPITASDPSELRRNLAAKLGADQVLDPGQGSAFDAWKDAIGMRTPVIFECTGTADMLQRIIRAAPRESRIVCVGICTEDETIRPLTAAAKEVSLQFVLGYSPAEFVQTLHRIADGVLDVGDLITGRVGRSGVAGAFADLQSPDSHAKIMLDPRN
jgi:threonine dehydrogenase-like Zn-dependent dehydrogenase